MIRRVIVGLRHDVDTRVGLVKGVEKVMRVEDKFDARSTFFVRACLIKSEDDARILRKAEKEGWEIGLHLDSTGGPNAREKAFKELEKLMNLGLNVQGVTPHGGHIGFLGKQTWDIMDSLNLTYMQGYGAPPAHVRTIVLPQHITLDFHVKKYGEKNGVKVFLRNLENILRERGTAVILTHPEYLVFSVGSSLFMRSINVSRAQGVGARFIKILDNTIKILYTVTGRNLVEKPYEKVLSELKNHNVKLTSLIELAHSLRS